MPRFLRLCDGDYHLLPFEERSAFVQTYVNGMDEDTPPIHSAIARALLYGLSKDEEGAGQALLDLYYLHPLSYDLDYEGGATYRAWSFLLATGLQFQQWNLDGLAGALWERALRDEAALRLDGRQAGTIARDIRIRLAANNLVTMPPILGRLQLEEFLSEDMVKLAPALTNTLESTGYPQYSIRIYHDLWESDGTGMHHLRSFVNACRAAKAYTVGTDTLIASMENVVSTSNTMLFKDSVLQFASFLLSEKDLSNASRLLDAAEDHMPDDPMVLEHKARLALQQGDPAKAESLYRRILTYLPGNNQARLLLAGALDEQGKTSEAIALLERVPPGTAMRNYDAALASLYLKDGQMHRAETIIRRLVRANEFDSIPRLVESLAEHGNPREAQRILYGISERLTNDDNEFMWQAALLGAISPRESPDLFRRVALQLRDSASEHPSRWTDYLETWDRVARNHDLTNRLQSELEALWDNGDGPFAAGAKLFELNAIADRKTEAAARITDLLNHPDYDETLLQNVATHLAEAGHVVLAADLVLEMTERNPSSTDLSLNTVAMLNKAGRQDEATQLLNKLSARAVVDAELSGRVGMFYQAMGLKTEASNAFKHAILLDPYARSFVEYVNYAKLLIETGNLGEARRVLRYSFRNPVNSEVGVLVELVAAEGALQQGKDAVLDFNLSPQNLRRFTREAARRSAPK